MDIEVLGPEPACHRCKTALDIVSKAAAKVLGPSHEIHKRDAYAKETIKRFGLIATPAIALDGKVKIAGRVPTLEEAEALIKAEQHG